MSKIQPLGDRVLVKAAAAEEKTVGGIIIPDPRAGQSSGRRGKDRRRNYYSR